MPSNVSIANKASTKLGADRIMSLSDNTVVARAYNAVFNDIVIEELRRNTWKFALKRDSVLALVDSPEWGYQYQYPLPADYVRMVAIGEYQVRSFYKQQAPWSIEGNAILTNLAAPLKIRYIHKELNPAVFDPLFAEVVACKLAMETAITITGSNSKREQLMQEYAMAVTQATQVDAVEMEPDYLPNGNWLDSREDDGYYGSGEPWQAYPSGV